MKRYSSIFKYIIILSIIVFLFSGIMLVADSITHEAKKQQKLEDSKEIQKTRDIILEVNGNTAVCSNGKEYKISDEVKKQVLLKKWSDIYVNTTSNEIVKIDFNEETSGVRR